MNKLALDHIQSLIKSPDLLSKWDCLLHKIENLGSVVIAFSGGVDSSFLTYVSFLILGDKVTAVTAATEFMTEEQIQTAIAFTQRFGINHKILRLNIIDVPEVRMNPFNRCYFCKIAILEEIWKFAGEQGIKHVLEGQNLDDRADYRPGTKAVAETGTRSLLDECGLTKLNIRDLSHLLQLPTWDMSSSPCLATRVAVDIPLSESIIHQIRQCEVFLEGLGFTSIRVRYHGSLARIEVTSDQIIHVVENRTKILDVFRKAGFQHITVDLGGYQQGSLNLVDAL